MLLIWGWRTRFKQLAEGVFHCPGCGADRHYAHKQARRWFTLFFLPLLPLKVLGRHVECQTCRRAYDERVLELPTSAAVSEHLVAATLEAAVHVLRVDDTPAGRAAAVAALSRVSGIAWGEDALAADIAGLDVSPLPARLRQLGDVMNEHGKEAFLTSVATVAGSGGVLSGPAGQVLAGIAADLGMTPAHARGVIDQAFDPTR